MTKALLPMVSWWCPFILLLPLGDYCILDGNILVLATILPPVNKSHLTCNKSFGNNKTV
jgi:hypothetical protein